MHNESKNIFDERKMDFKAWLIGFTAEIFESLLIDYILYKWTFCFILQIHEV